jgi:type IV secretion system protein VirB4
LEERFDGAPAMLMLDEAWLFLDAPAFAARIREWLKTLRKKNVSVVFATQSLADIRDSGIAPAIVESCASRIFLSNPQALEPQIRTIYEGFGLNARQIQLVARATPKRDYYYQSRLGNRVFDLGLGPAALAFAGAAGPVDQRAIDAVLAEVGREGFAAGWLRHRGLDWAADMVQKFAPHPVAEASDAAVSSLHSQENVS